MASIGLQGLHKTYPNGRAAVRGIDLEVADGELVVLVGPSGSGKSTVLRMIAGLESPTSGRVFLGNRDVTNLPPQRRDVAMVFQNYALYPHLTVWDNLAFGLRMREIRSDQIGERVQRVARSLGLEQVLDRKPAQLSGGERQRVALGRAIAREPKAFLFDEPLSNLDTTLRLHTRAELSRLHRELGATMLHVTHDQEEAMTLGDRIAVMVDGQLQQVGPPLLVYERPANVFVAGFIGSPTMNVLSCSVRRDGPIARLHSHGVSLELQPAQHAAVVGNDAVLLGVRPHDIRLVAPSQADFCGRVDVIEPLGRELMIHLVADGAVAPARITLMAAAETAVAVNDRVGGSLRRDRLHLFDAKTTRRIDQPSADST